MNTTYPIAAVGELIGEPARAAILIALLDGKARNAGELALTANISAQSASAHLPKLVVGGLLTVRRTGRHRYYAMAGAEVAHALEALGSISTLPRARTATPRPLAADLAQALEKPNVIRTRGEADCDIGNASRAWFTNLGIDVDGLRRSRRAFARQCLDWTERRPHIAGALGAALCSRFLALGWIARRRGTRALRITHRGARELHSRLGLTA
jgi:DNA-binding transcriptional ArsR family regulator